MTKEDIIAMAREAGFPEAILELSPIALERFAALIIKSLKPSLQIEFEKMFMEGAAAEREACAKVCDDLWEDDGTAYDCAEAIRTLGQT